MTGQDAPTASESAAEPQADTETPAEQVERPKPPGMPIVHMYRSFLTNYRERADGGMELVITPAQATPNGTVMLTPQIVLAFGTAEGWEGFKAEVAADGMKQPARPKPVIARVIPPNAPPPPAPRQNGGM